MISRFLPRIGSATKFPLFPTIPKLLVASALFFFWGWFVWPGFVEAAMTDWRPVGFPLPIRATGLCIPSPVCVEFNWQSVLLDAAFWYVLGALVVHTRPSMRRSVIYFLGALFLTAILAHL